MQLTTIFIVDLSIILLFKWLVAWSMKCQKMVENVDQCFPKPKTTSLNVLFFPQPKDIQFTVTEEERNQKIFTFKKLESENFGF